MKPVLIGCEYSATVSTAFRNRGFETYSCDFLPTEGDPRFHFQQDVEDAIRSRDWSLIVLHPPCTALAICGNTHYGPGKPKHQERLDAVEWTKDLWQLAKSHADHVALENPVSVIFKLLDAKDTQYVNPWMFGHTEQKKTGLALHELPRLEATSYVLNEMYALDRKDRERVLFMAPSEDRQKERARFHQGIAEAMAEQWGSYIAKQASFTPTPCESLSDSEKITRAKEAIRLILDHADNDNGPDFMDVIDHCRDVYAAL